CSRAWTQTTGAMSASASVTAIPSTRRPPGSTKRCSSDDGPVLDPGAAARRLPGADPDVCASAPHLAARPLLRRLHRERRRRVHPRAHCCPHPGELVSLHALATTLIDGRCTPVSCRLAAAPEVGSLGPIPDLMDAMRLGSRRLGLRVGPEAKYVAIRVL